MLRRNIVDDAIKTGIDSLANDWSKLNHAYENFAKKKLQFAKKVSTIWAKAKKLDEKHSSEANKEHLKKELCRIIHSDNKSILSRWVSIGQNADHLLPYADSLPSNRDSLYALSVATRKKQPIKSWISNGRLSSESTVRQVLALTKTQSRKPSAEKLVDFVKISFPEKGAYQAFYKIRDELEAFLRSKNIPFTYFGDLARYDRDLSKYNIKIEKEVLRLLRNYLRKCIRMKIDYIYFKVLHRSQSRSVPFSKRQNEVSKVLAITDEEVDVNRCVSLGELRDLYMRLELNQDMDWTQIESDLYQTAMEKHPLPTSVKRIDIMLGVNSTEQIGSVGKKRLKKYNFSELKIY
jgi:hypothetical protein